MTLAMRDQPYIGEHYASASRRMERGKMPKSLAGLVHWYVTALSEELPERLHKAEPWHDQVSAHERDEGIRPVGGSHLGSPAYSGGFRLILEAGASVTDEDGYYVYPVRAALSRMHRRWALMARNLFALGMAGGDVARVADSKPGWALEEFEVYIEESLRRLWLTTHDRTTRDSA